MRMKRDPSKIPLPYRDTKAVGAADFYFAINATFRFIERKLGKESLVKYWSDLGAEYYAPVTSAWKQGGLAAVSAYWKSFFQAEPGADVEVSTGPEQVRVEVRVCPAIKHLREHGRGIVSCFCQHCYFVSEAMGKPAGITVRVKGGNGCCDQTFSLNSCDQTPQDLSDIKEVR